MRSAAEKGASGGTGGGSSGGRSSLDKPLEELTDEDIFQLTREDCRRYLKEKGMRRPSWNKSQAIQQVLTLKSLFESKAVQEPPQQQQQQQQQEEEANEQQRNHLGAKNNATETCRESSSAHSDVSQDRPRLLPCDDAADKDKETQQDACRVGDASLGQIPSPLLIRLSKETRKNHVHFHNHANSTPLNQAAAAHESSRSEPKAPSAAAQLTIFYSGSVNVYENVPADKARAVMLMAAAAASENRTPNGFSLPGVYQNGAGVGPGIRFMLHPSANADPAYNEMPTKSRRASVQRFLKKRKDRGRLRPPPATAAASVDMYLNVKSAVMRASADERHRHKQRHVGDRDVGIASDSDGSSPATGPTNIPVFDHGHGNATSL